MAATQEGVEKSIHERLMEKYAPDASEEPETEESTDVETKVEGEEIEEVHETAQPETDASPETDESQANTYEIDDVAAFLGVDIDKLDVDDEGQLLIKTNIDGETGAAKFTDFLESYQKAGHLNNENIKATEAQKQYQAKIEEYEKTATEKLTQLENLTAVVAQELVSDFNINWEQLKADDPDEYNTRFIDYQRRQQQVSQLLQQVQAKRDELSQVDTEKQQQDALAQWQETVKAFPTWADETVANKEAMDLRKYAVDLGASVEDANSISNPLIFKLLAKAQKWDALEKKKPEVSKKVIRAPKIVKSGSGIPKNKESEEVAKARKNVKTGGKGAFAQYLLKSGRIK